jgi:hypothetical protein
MIRGHSCATMGRQVIVGTHCCASVIYDNDFRRNQDLDNSTTMTYVMWREERLWNVGILQRVHLCIIRIIIT